MPAEVLSEFVAEPPQWAFMSSGATVRGYGGAMGGGKSRTLMEVALDYAIDFPGIQILVVRKLHTTIIETTKKTFVREVLPSGINGPLVAASKQSQGEDWIDIWSSEPGVASRINFIGLENPEKWFSSELGCLIFDEAHEIAEHDALLLMTRLRQRGMPHRTLFGFNPGNPGHWLQKWFILGASETEHGFYKRDLVPSEASAPVGDCEFIFANAYANPHLPGDYIDRTLKSLPEVLKRRLLDGEWVLTDGSLFFDAEALTAYGTELLKPRLVGETVGEIDGSERIRLRARRDGPWAVWEPPVRDKDGRQAHRYLVAVDVSSGGGADYTGIQVIDLEEFAQVAEYQAKVDPDLAALEAFRAAAIYNGACIVPEITGGWGQTIVRSIERLLPKYKGPSKPWLYRRRIEDRLTKKLTDALGWNTNTKTRMLMLDTLAEALRDRSFRLCGRRTYEELKAFARDERGRPAALSGEHDDLVIPLAIAVFVASSQPRQVRRLRERPYEPAFAATGY